MISYKYRRYQNHSAR